MGCKKLLMWGAPTLATFAGATQAKAAVVAGTIDLPAGVDIDALIQSGVTVLAGIVGVALAAWGSWLIVRKCLKWVRKSF